MEKLHESNSSDHSAIEDHICKLVLYWNFPNTRIRVWDVVILTPNLLFLLFLLFHANQAILKLRATSSPIWLTFYSLVVLDTVMSILRSVVSMCMTSTSMILPYVDILSWVIVRFFLLSTEMSVIIFCLAFGHLDNRSSIQHVLLVTSFISFGYSSIQGALEILQPDKTPIASDTRIFGHGGIKFWFVSSCIFSSIYMVLVILPCTRLRGRCPIPAKKSFYIYIYILMLLNLSQSIGSGLLFFDVAEGVCVVDVTTFFYYTLFTPLVYVAFLYKFFSVAQSNLMLQPVYKPEIEDTMEDDTVSLPHQQSFSSLRTDSDYVFQGNSAYGSTQFAGGPGNMLYSASLQSPDSITGYSLNSQTIDIPACNKPTEDN